LIPNVYNSKKSLSLSSLIGFPNLSLRTALNIIGVLTWYYKGAFPLPYNEGTIIYVLRGKVSPGVI
jgi:hypothetical protein